VLCLKVVQFLQMILQQAWLTAALTLGGHEALVVSGKVQPSILLRGCGNVNILQLPPNVTLAVPVGLQNSLRSSSYVAGPAK
jgi:hypothetical protein